MELKKLIIVLSIAISIMIGLMFGVSYGWYAYKNAESTIAGTTIEEIPTIIFSQTEYMKLTKISPIYDEDRYHYASKNSFTVTLGENLKDYETGISISLSQIAISDELKITNFKYELLENEEVISSGDFSSIGAATTLTLKPIKVMSDGTFPKTINYELYIWLSDDGTNQNNLMNKGFSAKIDINSAIKK